MNCHMLIARISTGLCSPRKLEPLSYYKPILPTLCKAEFGMAGVQVYPDVFEDSQTFHLSGQKVVLSHAFCSYYTTHKKQLSQLSLLFKHISSGDLLNNILLNLGLWKLDELKEPMYLPQGRIYHSYYACTKPKQPEKEKLYEKKKSVRRSKCNHIFQKLADI